MRHFKFLFILPMLFFVVNCGNVKSENDSEDGKVVVLNKADFLTKVYDYEKNSTEWIYMGDKPCIIDFYADWCGPCKFIAPIMEELASEYKDKIVIYKIDVDKEEELASVFGISSIPLILFVPVEGQPQAARGALPKKTIVEQINKLLLNEKL
ncbi:MAG: thioredoxin [Tannerella sp.]|nr:thioredoxin [Tannerella sp.]